MHNISDNNLSMYCLKKNCHIDFLFPRKRHQTHPIQFKWIFCFSVWIDSSVIPEDFDCFLLRSWGFLWTIFIEGWGGKKTTSEINTFDFSSFSLWYSAICSSFSSMTSFRVSTWYTKLFFSLSSWALETIAFLYFSSTSASESYR